MQEKYQSMITSDGWIICAKCGRKLAKVLCGINSTQQQPVGRSEAIIELKCHSCKSLNLFGGGYGKF